MDIQATGVLSYSQPFERAALTSFQISPQTILPTGVYTDTPRQDSLNGYYDRSLVITAGVNVVISGTYSLSTDLLDSQGNPVAHSVIRQNLPPGPAVLPLEFIGQDIYASGSDGPYTLSNLLLSDQSGITLVTADQKNVFQTQPYDHKQFGIMLAQFSASPTSGIMPLVVQFTNTSTGYFDTSLWNFGDNITSVLTSPKHTYSTPGLYTVTLSMSGRFGTSIKTKVKYITVYPPSQANFTASLTTGIAPYRFNSPTPPSGITTPASGTSAMAPPAQKSRPSTTTQRPVPSRSL